MKLTGGQGGLLPHPYGWPHLPYLELRVLWRRSRLDGEQLVLLPIAAVLDGPGEVAPVLRPLLPVLWVVHEGAGVQRTPVLEGLSPIQELQRFCCWPRLLCLVLWGRSHPHGDHPGLVLTAAVLDGPGEAAPVPGQLLQGGEVGHSVGRGSGAAGGGPILAAISRVSSRLPLSLMALARQLQFWDCCCRGEKKAGL